MKRTANYEIVIVQDKENRRYRVRGIFNVFLATLFSTVAIFVTAGISVSALYKNMTTLKKQSNESSDEYQDIRYTLVDDFSMKEYMSEDDIAEEDEYIERERQRIENEKRRQERREKESELDLPEGDRIVYLTFDDGPGPDTERLLDILKEYDVKATFFVTCGHSANRDMIKRAYDEGHSIGLHTCAHNYSKIYESEDAYFDDLNDIADVVKNTTGEETKLIRFPGGSSNTVSATYNRGIMSRLTQEVEERGYVYFDWNVSSGDAGSANSGEMVYNNIIRSLRGDYSVVLQHDTKGFSVDAVEDVIQFGLDNGFTFKALDEDSPTAHHGINN